MLKQALSEQRCLIVCGGGGVGKTTIAASLAIKATEFRKRVLVVTIDPSKRLAEAFGFTERALIDGGEPLKLSDEVKAKLGIALDRDFSVGILNPKYVLDQVLDQTLTEVQRDKLKKTILYGQMSSMVYGLQEYTAYEWVTRMIQNNQYDFIVLDTPPAHHAKDFFNVPDRIRNLMESKVFQIFVPKAAGWFTKAMSFGWVEKLLGEKIYSESRVFFETFAALRERILERCLWLSRFFTQKEVAVVTVSTTESSGQFELEGLVTFLRNKKIPLQSIILNQVETGGSKESWEDELKATGSALYEKMNSLHQHQQKRAEKAQLVIEKCKRQYEGIEVLEVPMTYSDDGFEILRSSVSKL